MDDHVKVKDEQQAGNEAEAINPWVKRFGLLVLFVIIALTTLFVALRVADNLDKRNAKSDRDRIFYDNLEVIREAVSYLEMHEGERSSMTNERVETIDKAGTAIMTEWQRFQSEEGTWESLEEYLEVKSEYSAVVDEVIDAARKWIVMEYHGKDQIIGDDSTDEQNGMINEGGEGIED